MRRRAYPFRLTLSLIFAPIFGGMTFGFILAVLKFFVQFDPWSQLEIIPAGAEATGILLLVGAASGLIFGIPVGGLFAAIAHAATARRPIHGLVFGALAGTLSYSPFMYIDSCNAWTVVFVIPLSAALGWATAAWSYRDRS